MRKKNLKNYVMLIDMKRVTRIRKKKTKVRFFFSKKTTWNIFF